MSSIAEVFLEADIVEVFYQMREALKYARRYVARLIRRTGGARRIRGADQVKAQVRARKDLRLDCRLLTGWLLGTGERGRNGRQDERQ